MIRLCLVLLIFSLPTTALAEPIIGRASVIDADTLEIHGKRIRLHGIDAPESDQLCTRQGKSYRCGQAAALALDDQIAGAPVMCEPLDTDRYKRIIARCRLGGIDLGAWLVHEGHALAYRPYSLDYVDQEEWARRNRLGMWSGEFQMPWEYRKERRND